MSTSDARETSDLDRYIGCLWGLACGDALGGPVEFDSREAIASTYPHGLRDFIGGGWLRLAPGEITDDTQMTLALARSLTDRGHLDMVDVARRFVAWAATEPKDIGNTTRAAIRLLDAGVSWDEAGERIARGGAAAGNGSIMRCAPIALRFRTDPVALRQASIDSARVTHADHRCTWGAVAFNQALRHVLNGGSREGLIDAAISHLNDVSVRRCVSQAVNRSRDEIKSGGFVLDTLGAALWCVFQTSSFEEAVVTAVGLGADTDTTGAVAGALAGALYGRSAIPARWLDLLEPREELRLLATVLLRQSSANA